MTAEDWAEIRRLHRVEQMPIKAIVRRLGVSRNAVRRALARDAPPKYERPAKGSLVGAVEPAVRELLAGCPTMPATVIAERIGWSRSLTILKGRVRVLRPYGSLGMLTPTEFESAHYAALTEQFQPA
jgi:transposase